MDSPDNIELSVEKKQSKSIHTFEEAVSLIGMYNLELATNFYGIFCVFYEFIELIKICIKEFGI